VKATRVLLESTRGLIQVVKMLVEAVRAIEEAVKVLLQAVIALVSEPNSWTYNFVQVSGHNLEFSMARSESVPVP
jgi:hypothetical protein